jgi:hypothetical protein
MRDNEIRGGDIGREIRKREYAPLDVPGQEPVHEPSPEPAPVTVPPVPVPA